jgi:nonsense-mediated mRNA decay protein 3
MWTALVQVRQRVHHKRTFFFLEQMLLKHNAHSDCLSIQVRNSIAG